MISTSMTAESPPGLKAPRKALSVKPALLKRASATWSPSGTTHLSSGPRSLALFLVPALLCINEAAISFLL